MCNGNHAAGIVKFATIIGSIGITPQQITQQSGIGNIAGSFKVGDLVQFLQLRRQPAMHAQDSFVNHSGGGQTIKDIGKDFPQFDGILPFAFVVKSINAIDTGTFVIAS